MKKFSYLDMVKELLSEKEVLEFEKYYTKAVQKSLKPLFSRIDFSLFEKTLKNTGRLLKKPNFSLAEKLYDDVFFVEKLDRQSLWSHWMHQAGLFYVQEMAAGMSAQVLDVNSGDVVLDMCSAPGGKSIQLADRLQLLWNDWLLISNELNPQRRKALLSNIARCWITSVVVTWYDGRKVWEFLYEHCDKVLLDAPCSGEGMQYKSDVRVYGRNEKSIRKIAYLQQELLISGLMSLKVWWELVYSTCTTNVIENEMVVASVLKKFWESIGLFSIEIDQKSDWISEWRGEEILSVNNSKKVARFWPHIQHTWGFFIAKFKKLKSFWKTQYTSLDEKMTIWDFSADIQERVWCYLKNNFWLQQENFPEFLFVKSTFGIQVVSKGFFNIEHTTLFFDQIGFPILKILKDGSYIPLIGLAKIFWWKALKAVLDINDDQAERLMKKIDLYDHVFWRFEWMFVLLRWNGIGIGLVSVQHWVAKNKY